MALLARSTRSVQLTEAGRRYHARLSPLLAGLEEADLELQAHRAEPRGTLRVSVPHAFGRRWVLPTLLAFQRRWPAVTVRAQFSDRFTDPLAADVTIRGGRLPDAAGVVARKLVGFEELLCASPAYLDRHGAPGHPEELVGAPGCHYTGNHADAPWQLTRGSEACRIDVAPVFEADNGEALVEAALRGHGLLLQPDFLVGPLLASGALVRLLPDWSGRTGNFWTMTPSRLVAATARLFIEALRQDLAGAPWNASR